MSNEKRTKKMSPIPDNFKKILNPLQLMALRNVEGFGWELYFVRRNGVEVPIPVVKGVDGETLAVIDEDGNVDTNPKLTIRN